MLRITRVKSRVRKIGYIVSLLSVFLLAGCGSTASLKEREQLAKAVYGTRDAIAVNRFDLAKQYSEESTRLIAPPKDRIAIKGVLKPARPVQTTNSDQKKYDDAPQTSSNYVILPEGLSQDDVVIVGSDKWQEMLAANDALRKQIQKEQDTIKEVQKENDKTLREKDEELAKYRGKQSLITRINDFFHGGFTALLVKGGIIAGVILVACIILRLLFKWTNKRT